MRSWIQTVNRLYGCFQTHFLVTPDYNPWRVLVNHTILIHFKKFFSCFKFRIFSKLIHYPGQVCVAQKIQIIFSLNDLIKNITMAFAKNKFAPYFKDVHVGVDEEKW